MKKNRNTIRPKKKQDSGNPSDPQLLIKKCATMLKGVHHHHGTHRNHAGYTKSETKQTTSLKSMLYVKKNKNKNLLASYPIFWGHVTGIMLFFRPNSVAIFFQLNFGEIILQIF